MLIWTKNNFNDFKLLKKVKNLIDKRNLLYQYISINKEALMDTKIKIQTSYGDAWKRKKLIPARALEAGDTFVYFSKKESCNCFVYITKAHAKNKDKFYCTKIYDQDNTLPIFISKHKDYFSSMNYCGKMLSLEISHSYSEQQLAAPQLVDQTVHKLLNKAREKSQVEKYLEM